MKNSKQLVVVVVLFITTAILTSCTPDKIDTCDKYGDLIQGKWAQDAPGDCYTSLIEFRKGWYTESELDTCAGEETITYRWLYRTECEYVYFTNAVIYTIQIHNNTLTLTSDNGESVWYPYN